MVRRRRPVSSLQEALLPQVQPQAGPVGFTPTVAPPPDLPVYDFANISRTISGYLAKQQDKRNKKLELEGEQFVERNRAVITDLELDMAAEKDPAKRDRMQKEAFAALRRAGEIPDMADPNRRVGYDRATGRAVVGQYWQNLQHRLAQMPAPAIGVPGMDAEAVMAEEWAKIADSPAIRSFYGGQEALAQKVQADAQFLQAVTARQSEAEEQHYRTIEMGEIGKLFDAALADHDLVTALELKPVSAYVQDEVQNHGLLNPREVVLKALELSIQRRAAVDPEEAIRAVHAAQDLVIGGVRLGDDRSGVGQRLQELTLRVRQDARQAAQDEVAAEDAQRKLMIQQGQADYVPVLLQAKRDGVSLRQVAARLEEQYLAEDSATGRFKGRGAFVVDSMHDYAQALEGQSATDPEVLDRINILIADDQLDAAEALARASMRNRTLSGEHYGATTQQIEQRRDVSRFMEEDSLYNTIRGRYRQAAPKGYSDEVQENLDAQSLERERRLARDFATYARSTAGQPNREELHRVWLETREAADSSEMRKIGQELRVKRDTAVGEIRRRLSRFQDAAEVIDQAEHDGALTVAEAGGLRTANVKSGKGRARLAEQAFAEAAQTLDARLTAHFGGPAVDQDQITIQSEARRRLRDQIDGAVDALIADPAADPRRLSERARAEGQRLVDEMGDKLFPSARKAVQRGLEAGQSLESVEAETARRRADKALGAGLETILADPAAREGLSLTSPILAPGTPEQPGLRNPAVPERFYKHLAAWWSGRDPIFGTPVRRVDMDRMAFDLAVSPPDPAKRDEVVLTALDVVGMDALQVLRGELILEPDQGAARLAREQLAQHEAGVQAGRWPDGGRGERLRRVLTPVRVPLGEHALRPYITPFFRSREAFDSFSNDPAYPDFLRRLGLDPADTKEIETWESYQVQAIDRSAR